MTSRQRLMAAIKHEIPDRVPISTHELIGWDMDSWYNKQPSYKSMMDYIRQNTDCIYMTRIPTVNRYIKEHTHVEQWREGKSTYIRTVITTPKGDLNKVDRLDDDINTVWRIEHMVKNDADIARYLSIPTDLESVDTGPLKKVDEQLGDKGILLISVDDPLCLAAELFEFGDFTVKAFTDREIFVKILDAIFEQQIFFLEDMLKKGAGPLFRIVGPEYATSPYLHTEQFHDFVCRYDSKMIGIIHDYGQYVRVHCHGRIRDVLPHIIEMEADALDPLEAPPSGDITLSEVKKLYGSKLCLMGNIQLKDLEYALPEVMRNITIECMKAAKTDGGYVIMPTAAPINIPLSQVTERNYRIFIDTALEYGEY